MSELDQTEAARSPISEQRVVFLDIDGVLNDTKHLRQVQERHNTKRILPITEWDAREHIDPARVARLNALLDRTCAVCVLSSSWRKRPGTAATLEALREHGFMGVVIGETPSKMSYVPRHREIKWWLERHGVPHRMVILDDDQEAGVGLTDHYVFVPDGLEDEHVQKAVRMLGGPVSVRPTIDRA